MSTLNVSRPPPGAEIQRWVIASGTELATLRSSLKRVLTQVTTLTENHREELGERLILVATELATNALQHGTPPAVIRLHSHHDYLVLDVADSDLTSSPHLTDPTVTDYRGRGLVISQSLSSSIGWYTTTTSKHTWAAFRHPPPAAP